MASFFSFFDSVCLSIIENTSHIELSNGELPPFVISHSQFFFFQGGIRISFVWNASKKIAEERLELLILWADVLRGWFRLCLYIAIIIIRRSYESKTRDKMAFALGFGLLCFQSFRISSYRTEHYYFIFIRYNVHKSFWQISMELQWMVIQI